MRFHFTPFRMATRKKKKKRKEKVLTRRWRVCSWEYNMMQLLCGIARWFLKKLDIELPYEPAIPLVGLHSKYLKSGPGRDMCTPMFKAALLTRAKRWKQLKCPSTVNG